MTNLPRFRQKVKSKPPSSVIWLYFMRRVVYTYIRHKKETCVSIFVREKDESTRIEEDTEKDKRSRARALLVRLVKL